MRRLFLFLFILGGLSVLSWALDMDVWRASNTATADTLQNLCPGKQYLVDVTTITEGNHGIFHGACINTGATGSLVVYNSSSTATSPIATINTATAQPCSFYDVMVSSGLTYTSTTTANVTLLYQCY